VVAEETMQYACLVYQEATTGTMGACHCAGEALEYREELRQNGYLLASTALQPVHSAVTVRVRQGEVSTAGGPFAETKEHLTGVCLIEARDLNEAIRVAAGMPDARTGSIEVRPLAEESER
jgi:hypothetical protein